MLSAALLIAGLVAGKIAIASLGVAGWATLASAGFTVAQVAGKVVVYELHKHPVGALDRPRSRSTFRLGTPQVVEASRGLCFTGAPSGWSAHPCP